jgi:hypothetical protein
MFNIKNLCVLSTLFIYISHVILNIYNNFPPCINRRVFLTKANCVLSEVRNISLYIIYIRFRLQLVVPRFTCLVAGLSPRKPGFCPRSVHVRSVEDKVAKRQTFFCLLQLSPVSIIPRIPCTRLHLRVALNWSTKEQNLGKFQKQCSVGNQWALKRNLFSSQKVELLHPVRRI